MFRHESSGDDTNIPYADDSSFNTVGNTVAEIETNLNQDLKKVTHWCTKTECLSAKVKQKLCFCAQTE